MFSNICINTQWISNYINCKHSFCLFLSHALTHNLDIFLGISKLSKININLLNYLYDPKRSVLWGMRPNLCFYKLNICILSENRIALQCLNIFKKSKSPPPSPIGLLLAFSFPIFIYSIYFWNVLVTFAHPTVCSKRLSNIKIKCKRVSKYSIR